MQLSKVEQKVAPDHELHEKVDHALREIADIRREARNKIPVLIDEYLVQTKGTTLDIPPQSRNAYKAGSLTIYVGPTGGATVTIGGRIFNVLSGLTTLTDLGWIIRYEDVRNVTATQAGALFMEITGEALADQYGW